MPKPKKDNVLFSANYTPKIAKVSKVTVKIPSPQLGVFFDGTGNNQFNDDLDPGDDNAPTNIAKLHALYPPDEKLVKAEYIEGVGTHAGKTDDKGDIAFAFSFGERIKDAVLRLQRFCVQYRSFRHAKVDVFGFSRGAAAARAFVNEVHHISRTDPAFWSGVRIEFRFLGIFDTVGSIGLPSNEDNNALFSRWGMKAPINLNIGTASVKKSAHLTAMDEYRDNFPLSSMKTSGGQLASQFIEEVWPGAHSDVGGGYGPTDNVVYFPEVIDDKQMAGFRWSDEQLVKRARDIKTMYENRYPLPGINVEVVYRRERRRLPMSAESREIYHYTSLWRRKIDPRLAHTPLHRMHQLAVDAGVPLRPLDELKNNIPPYPYDIPTQLQQWVDAVRVQGKKAAEYDNLYKSYIHHSHQYGRAPGSLINPHAPDKDRNVATTNGVRQVFFNHPDKATQPVQTTARAQTAAEFA